MNYNSITTISLEATCVDLTDEKWELKMKGARKANKKAIDRLVKKLLPELHYSLALDFYNPYNYLRTETHLILVHSGIEYFLTYQ